MNRLQVGDGFVELDPEEATPVAFEHPRRPAMPWLLQEDTDPWHTELHRWGRGFAVTDRGSFRWGRPDSVDADELGGVHARTSFGGGLTLEVERRGGIELQEIYQLRNHALERVEVSSLAISTPWRDVYDSAADSLERGCHAHVWTGGAWAWVLAEPMDGRGPVLGLTLRGGELWSYSIESRNTGTGSNVRGHVLLHLTDHARNASANGGQPVLSIDPGQALTWSFAVRFHPDRRLFLAATDPPLTFDRLCADHGDAIVVIAQRDIQITVDGTSAALAGPSATVRLTGQRPGTAAVDVVDTDGRHSRTMVLFTDDLESLVRRRVTAVLTRHRDHHAEGLRRFAFLAMDTETGLTVHAPDWPDWTDGAERVGMAVLVQQAQRLGWTDPTAADPALVGYAQFARTHLVGADGTVRRGSIGPYDGSRLYDYPWLAHFFADHYAMYRHRGDLDLAVRILHRFTERGGTRFLAIGWTEAAQRIAELCRRDGDSVTAERVEQPLRESADWFATRGATLAAHEVNYEQTIIASLATLLATYGRLDDQRHRRALREAVRWLVAFGGPQPHVRLSSVPIRHWDGYWFGRDRVWGDVFPHYWSVVTATALGALPADLMTDDFAEHASRIWHATLTDFTASDTPTCAFVFPSCIDGRPAHRPDPVSNDQDWALALRLRAMTSS